MTKFSDYFPDDDIEWLRSLKLDVALRFGFRILRGEVLNVAKHGVWSFHHGDNRHYRGGPAGFWEVYERAPTTGAILQRLTEDLDGGEVLYRTSVPTHPFSAFANRATLYCAAARGLSAALQRLSVDKSEHIICTERVLPYSARMYGPPSAPQALKAISSLYTRRVAGRLANVRRKLQWHVGYRFDRLHQDGDIPDLSPHRLVLLSSPAGALWADPFVARDGNQHWIFFEEVPVGETNGRISVVGIDDKGKAGEVVPVLAPSHHLSYPCLFRWEGSWFMAPESYDAGRQDIYRATSFPYDWERVRTIFEGAPIVDPTIFEHDSKWWLFASRPTPSTLIGEELLAWYSDTPLGDWTPHPMNPLRAGVDGSRPAGLPFRVGGRLVRPGQVGVPRYGAGVRFFEVEELSTEYYEERSIGDILPRWDSLVFGYHTINSAGSITVGDLLIDRKS